MSGSDDRGITGPASAVSDIADDSPTANRRKPDFTEFQDDQQALETELGALIRARDDLARRNRELTDELGEASSRAEHAEYLAKDLLSAQKRVSELEQQLEEAREAPIQAQASLEIYRESLAQDELKLRSVTAERDELKKRLEALEPLEKAAPADESMEMDFQETVAGLCDQLEEAAAELRQKDVQMATVVGEADEQRKLVAHLRDELQATRAAKEQLLQDAEKNADVIKALGESRDQLAALQDDLGRKQEIIELLDSSIRRLEVDEGPAVLDRTSVQLPLLNHPEPAPRSRVPRIELLTPGAWADRYPLHDSVMTIGRGSRSDIRLAREQISRQHARITVDEDGAVIEDLDSKNGVYVNGQRLKRCERLSHGDVVRLADIEMRFADR